MRRWSTWARVVVGVRLNAVEADDPTSAIEAAMRAADFDAALSKTAGDASGIVTAQYDDGTPPESWVVQRVGAA